MVNSPRAFSALYMCLRSLMLTVVTAMDDSPMFASQPQDAVEGVAPSRADLNEFRLFMEFQAHRSEFLQWRDQQHHQGTVTGGEHVPKRRSALLGQLRSTQRALDIAGQPTEKGSAQKLRSLPPVPDAKKAATDFKEKQDDPSKWDWEHICLYGPIAFMLLFMCCCGVGEFLWLLWQGLSLEVTERIYYGLIPDSWREFDRAHGGGDELPTPPDDEKTATKEINANKTVKPLPPPARAMMEKQWDQLTSDQQSMWTKLGVKSSEEWDTGTADVFGKYWQHLKGNQKMLLGRLGFTQGSWDNSHGIPLQEKTWADLSEFERSTAFKLGIRPAPESVKDWDDRASPIWSKAWCTLTDEEHTAAKHLGFHRVVWDNGEYFSKMANQPPGAAHQTSYLAQLEMHIFETIVLAACAWTIWILYRTGLIKQVTVEALLYVILAIAVVAIVVMAGKRLFNVVVWVKDSILAEASVMFEHLKDVWRMVQNIHAIHYAEEGYETIKKTCGCVPKKPKFKNLRMKRSMAKTTPEEVTGNRRN